MIRNVHRFDGQGISKSGRILRLAKAAHKRLPPLAVRSPLQGRGNRVPLETVFSSRTKVFRAMNPFLILGLAIGAEVTATLALKAADG